MSKKIVYVWLGLVILVAVGGGLLIRYDRPVQTQDNALVQNEIAAVLKVGEQTYEAKVPEQTTAYGFMTKLASTTALTFTSKYATGLGYYIEEINGAKSNDGAYWTLYINGKESMVGVSSYVLKDNDIIEWKLIKM
jgi:hypothetical protein